MAVSTLWTRKLIVGLAMAGAASAIGAAAGRGAAEAPAPAPAMAPQRGGGAPAGPEQAVTVPPLRFRYVGPANAGRVASVAGIPGDPTTYYLGAAAGGVWKTTDSGETWAPMFDKEPVQAIGALAVAPSDHNIVWAGTGEAWVIRDSDIGGDGIYKSTDAGVTWKNMGLEATGRIGRIIVDPKDSNVVYVCAIGQVTGPQQDRGVFKTSDGGATWKRALFVDPNTGCSGLSMDTTNPDVLIAGMWQVEIKTWGEFSGGPGSGVYITHDGGATWKKAESGMPRPPVGKIDVAIAPSNSNRMYALIETANQGSLWRSDDAGATWTVVSWNRTLIGRAGYYIRIAVNPSNADDVFILNSSFHRSTDGGKTFPGGFGGGGGCGDCHDVWIDPTDPGRYVLTDDGGARITSPTGSMSVSLPIGQMYHVATDDRMPYWIYSNRQDDGTMRGPNDAPVSVPNVPSYAEVTAVPSYGGGFGGRGFGRGRGGRGGAAGARGAAAGARGAAAGGQAGAAGGRGAAPAAFGGGFGGGRGRGEATTQWQAGIGGCESGFTVPVPTNPDVVWASCYGDEVTRFDDKVGRARSVAPWIHTLDSSPVGLKYRCHWTPPLVMDPFDPETVYYGCNVIFKTTDQGQTWSVISPDLSTQDPAHIVSSGGIQGDNLGQFYGELVFAIAPSPIAKGLIWAGTNDGKLWYTRDGGGHWVDVTKNIAGLPPLGTVTQISPSSFEPGAAYVSFDLHLVDDRKPYLFKTSDFGRTWTKISDGLPQNHPLDYTKSIAEDPNKQGLLFAGTGHGFYYSDDDGRTWTNFQSDLPRCPVTWITVQKTYHDVVISTYGRGLWVLDDITRLEQTGQTSPTASAVALYKPRDGMREARAGSARFLFTLPSAPSGPVKFEILDSTNALVRTFEVEAHEGLNAATWDLRYEPPNEVELRTTPPDNPHIWDEARFQGRDTRPVTHWGIQGAQRAAPIAAPGRFTVRMTAEGHTVSQPFEVVKDMMIPSSDADLAASTAAQVRIRDAMNATVEMTNRVEVLRKQVQDLLKANQGKDELEKPLMDLDQKMQNVELIMLSKSDMYSDDKWYVEVYHLYDNLIWLNGVIGFGAGDVAGGAEYRPTAAAMQWLGDLEKQLAQAKTEFATLVNTDVPAFNTAMAGKLPPIK
jgi:Sortilin, neurotensin receptor 3,